MPGIILLSNMATQLNLPSCGIDFNEFGHIFNQSLDQCLSSRLSDALNGKKIIFSMDERSLIPVEGWGIKSDPYCTTTITTIQPIQDNTIVSAIDSQQHPNRGNGRGFSLCRKKRNCNSY